MTKLRLTRPTAPENFLSAFTQYADEFERRFAFGTDTFTWPGGTGVSTTTNVTHGLDRVPVAVLLTPDTRSGVTSFPACGLGALTATTFGAGAHTIDGEKPINGSTCTFYWIAVG